MKRGSTSIRQASPLPRAAEPGRRARFPAPPHLRRRRCRSIICSAPYPPRHRLRRRHRGDPERRQVRRALPPFRPASPPIPEDGSHQGLPPGRRTRAAAPRRARVAPPAHPRMHPDRHRRRCPRTAVPGLIRNSGLRHSRNHLRHPQPYVPRRSGIVPDASHSMQSPSSCRLWHWQCSAHGIGWTAA